MTIDFSPMADFVCKYSNVKYRKPENSDSPELMEAISKCGIQSVQELKNLVDLWDGMFNLGYSNKVLWTNGWRTKRSLWLATKMMGNIDDPETISLFIEKVRESELPRFRVAMIPIYNKSGDIHKKRYQRVFNLGNPEPDVCFVSYDRDNEFGEILSFDMAKNGDWNKKPWSGAAVSYIAKTNANTTNEGILEEINKGVRLLLPYYQEVLS